MRKFIILALCLICFTACGKDDPPIEEIPTSTPEPPTEVYCYDLGGAFVDATIGLYPVPSLDDLEVWREIYPLYVFTLNSGSTVYVCGAEVTGWKSEPIGDNCILAKDTASINTVLDGIVDTNDESIVVVELDLYPVHLSETATNTAIQESVSGYTNPDIIMYAIATTEDGQFIAVCKQDLGHTVQNIFLQSGSLTCSLRDEEMTMLIEDTGELIPLTWYLNKEYTPVVLEIPENTP